MRELVVAVAAVAGLLLLRDDDGQETPTEQVTDTVDDTVTNVTSSPAGQGFVDIGRAVGDATDNLGIDLPGGTDTVAETVADASPTLSLGNDLANIGQDVLDDGPTGNSELSESERQSINDAFEGIL